MMSQPAAMSFGHSYVLRDQKGQDVDTWRWVGTPKGYKQHGHVWVWLYRKALVGLASFPGRFGREKRPGNFVHNVTSTDRELEDPIRFQIAVTR